MRLKQLNLENFRNYPQLNLEFNHGLTILTGENAQGKTNLLEAIFLLSLAKSHRSNHDNEMIRWHENSARVTGLVETEHFEFPLELILTNKGKKAKYNHLEQAKLSHFIGKLNVILFAPEDMQLIKGSPAFRRKFLDSELGQSHPVYLNELLEYNRILKQRNTYLKQYSHSNQFDNVYFSILTQQLIDRAVSIVRYRSNFVTSLNQLAQPIHQALSNERDQLGMMYLASSSHLDYQVDEAELKSQFQALFECSFIREKDQATTLYGPHRDDLGLYINDKKAVDFASQGQQRTTVLSLKLAEIELMKELKGEYPILLLDDVLSELDDARQHLLMSYIEKKVQTFLTTATIQGLKLHQLSDADIFYVENANVYKGESLNG
ncbi:DNA replication/repair protein RecF [Vaginisenegalia massiliensis]|uniref:DNA replication/repair protein RecF n=1 Tax=Vaginisenegalia massiliensis TaxID=2058294 RepID=UPI000F53CA54|nr:DNA replication/repair protein RecF [Vaginisenegalia massiliensis]